MLALEAALTLTLTLTLTLALALALALAPTLTLTPYPPSHPQAHSVGGLGVSHQGGSTPPRHPSSCTTPTPAEPPSDSSPGKPNLNA